MFYLTLSQDWSSQRYTEITHDPLPFGVAQGIFWMPWERLLRSTLNLIERGEKSLYSGSVLAVSRWLINCCISRFSLCYVAGIILADWNCTVRCTTTMYNFSCNDNGCQNFPGPCNRDVLYRCLSEDSDKIPEGKTHNVPTYLQGTTVYVPSSELGLSHPLSRQRLACGWGVVGVIIPTTGERS
jgi:hypothetical protein